MLWFGLALLWAFLTTAHAEESPPPVNAEVGIFLTSLHDLDVHNASYEAVFWLWAVHDGDAWEPGETLEIVNARSVRVEQHATDSRADHHWSTIKMAAEVRADWDVSDFPFDRQDLVLQIEDGDLDWSELRLSADAVNSRVDPALVVPGWDVERFEIAAEPVTVDTTYGDPTLSGQSTYGRITVTTHVRRQGTRAFFSIFSGIYVAFLLAALASWVPGGHFGARVTLIAAATFAAVGNKYVADAHLPMVSVVTLVDRVQIATFLAIGATTGICVAQEHREEGSAVALRLQALGRYVVPGVYLLANAVWIGWAVS